MPEDMLPDDSQGLSSLTITSLLISVPNHLLAGVLGICTAPSGARYDVKTAPASAPGIGKQQFGSKSHCPELRRWMNPPRPKREKWFNEHLTYVRTIAQEDTESGSGDDGADAPWSQLEFENVFIEVGKMLDALLAAFSEDRVPHYETITTTIAAETTTIKTRTQLFRGKIMWSGFMPTACTKSKARKAPSGDLDLVLGTRSAVTSEIFVICTGTWQGYLQNADGKATRAASLCPRPGVSTDRPSVV
ncbi:hypothetical protein B0H11DRAFT_2199024 [Mycena galericulata]|nr:hypothetical protein B0H11DRAFT_2199024 [Mycena galericulata]